VQRRAILLSVKCDDTLSDIRLATFLILKGILT